MKDQLNEIRENQNGSQNVVVFAAIIDSIDGMEK